MSTRSVFYGDPVRVARHTRDLASKLYQHGHLTELMQGLLLGQINILLVYTDIEAWILQGIENEINFFVRRARWEDQS